MSLVIYIVPVSSTVMYTYFSSLGKTESFRALQKSLKYTLAAVMPVGFLMSAFSLPIIKIFYTQSYLPAASALGVLGLVAVPLVVSQMLSAYFYGIGRPKIHTCVVLAVFLVCVALSYTMISAYGIWGAGMAMLVSRLVEVSVLLVLILALTRKRIILNNIIKPVAASLAIYAIAFMLPVSGIIELVAAGLALLALYAGILLAIGGIERADVATLLGWLKRK